MSKFIIQGAGKLAGQIQVSGAKNHALKLIPCAVLTHKKCLIKNVPEIEDVRIMFEILKSLGGRVDKVGDKVYELDTKDLNKTEIPLELGRKLRGSVMFAAPLLARFAEAKIPHPGGCMIGRRPIDIFLEGFRQLGVEIHQNNNYYHLKAPHGLKGAKIVFRRIAVTVTESMIMAATLASGRTKLVFAAGEPEIPKMAEFLNQMGAKIQGAGTHFVEIEGVESLKGGEFTCIPDRIETGTFAILGALTGGDLEITQCDPAHLEVFWLYLERAGVNFEKGRNFVKIFPSRRLKAVPEVTTHEYPGLVTDLQAPFTVLMSQARGFSLIHETVFEGRLFYIDTLNKMGANIIMCDPHRVIVSGPTPLCGTSMASPDARAGIALLIAALVARGESTIDNIYQIDRGYERIEERLRALGAKIKRI